MTNTTKTAVGSPQIYVVTAGEIEEFCEVTGDGNNIHKGGSPVVPGFLLVGIAKNHIGELVQGAHPELNFSGIEAKFTAKLHAGEDFVVKPTGSYDPSNGSIPYTISRTNDGVVVVEGKVRHQQELANPEKAYLNSHMLQHTREPRNYELTERLFEGVRNSLNLPHQDRIVAAVSLASNALLNDKESFDVQFFEGGQGKFPYFAKHNLRLYKGIEEALQEERLAIHTKPGRSKLATYSAYVRGVNGAGKPIFDLTCHIRFNEPK